MELEKDMLTVWYDENGTYCNFKMNLATLRGQLWNNDDNARMPMDDIYDIAENFIDHFIEN